MWDLTSTVTSLIVHVRYPFTTKNWIPYESISSSFNIARLSQPTTNTAYDCLRLAPDNDYI